MISPEDAREDEEFLAQFLEELASAPVGAFPEWDDADDLGRLHMQAAAGDLAVQQSRGRLRLTGSGVHANSLSFEPAGAVLSHFQRLVTASGASSTGVKTSRGSLPAEISRRTELALTTSPMPGSVILEFEPVSAEVEERYPNGEIPLVEENIPLIERGVSIALDVLAAAAAPEFRLQAIESLLQPLGVRVASAARSLAETAANAHLDLDVSWQAPGVGRRKVIVTAAQSATFSAALTGYGLDVETESFVGVLRTISETKKIDLEVPDPEDEGEVVTISIARGSLDLTPYTLGQRVEIQTLARVTLRPGGAEQRTYTATAISVVGDAKHE